MIRIHDPAVLHAQGALVDLSALQKPVITIAVPERRRRLFLRWQTAPAVGLPTEPFKVWRRPAFPLGKLGPVAFERIRVGGIFASDEVVILQFAEPLAAVSLVVVTAGGGLVVVAALAGPPVIEAIIGLQSRSLPAGGAHEFGFEAPSITGLLLRNVDNFDSVVGTRVSEVDKLDDWQLVETVGLPVDAGQWAPLGQQHGVKQGLVGAELPAIDAAADRFGRGINPLGWDTLLPGGVAAPPWELPDPFALVKEADLELLPLLRDVAAAAPELQADKLFDFKIEPPQNPAGEVMPATNPGTAALSPIGLLAITAGTDPMLAVTLGYGTGYDDVDIPRILTGRQSFFGNDGRSDWDWRITGRWERGLDGRSEPIEFAAVVPRPALALRAPTPADLAVDFQAALRPAVVDQPWLASIRASWERFPLNQLSNVASFAAARRRIGGPAEALLERRAFGPGHRPIGNVTNPLDPEPARQSATDGALPIPNDPGNIAMAYAAATQTIFGLWSPWVEGAVNAAQPAPAPVQILSARLLPVDPGSGSACPATLEFEISVDWRVRSVARVELAGALFAASSRSMAAPGPAAAPTEMQLALGAAAAPLAIVFAGDMPTLAGGSIIALNPGGDAEVVFGPAQTSSRRYRVTLPGFVLDYAATPHVGLVLRARAREALAPGHFGPWSPSPVTAYASDPRARATTVIDLVRLASLPDAAGQGHAHLDWSPVPGADGYAIYESTETRILLSHPGNPEPTPDRTLSQRLTTLKAAFDADPIRRDFTRRNAELVKTSAIDVTLPRGSRDIHLFTVIPVMPGGIEAPWPATSAALIPIAAPRVATPAPPTIEVQPIADRPPAVPDHRARLRIATRPGAGAVPRRIDIYRVRVDDAARQLDSMGPPIASITGTGGGWQVSGGAADAVAVVTGDDRPAGSWRNVWYRAVAWSADDPERGVLKGRSPPSPAVAVLVPPAGPPPLSALAVSWPGGDPAAVLVTFASAAPVADTPVGPHVISVEALVAGSAALVTERLPLSAVASAAPAIGSGLWREAAPGPGPGPGAVRTYRLLLRRAAIGDSLAVIVRLVDPLGRSSEATLAIAAGSVVPLPEISPVDAFAIAGRGTIYSFSTDAPDDDGAGGDFRIRVELVLQRVGPGPLEPFARLPRPPLGRPRPQFRLVDGVHVAEMAIAAVPEIDGVGGGLTLALGRRPGPARDQFLITADIALRSVTVTIIAPDGRTVRQRRRG